MNCKGVGLEFCYRPRHMNQVATISVLLFVMVAASVGCGGPVAPSVANVRPLVVSWDHLKTEKWQYSLQDPTRIADFRFLPHGVVTTSTGTKSGNVYSVSPIAYHWHIGKSGSLVLTDESEATIYMTFTLVSLTDSSAVLVGDGSTTKQEFTRRFSL